jgi:hypothetical protein
MPARRADERKIGAGAGSPQRERASGPARRDGRGGTPGAARAKEKEGRTGGAPESPGGAARRERKCVSAHDSRQRISRLSHR